MTLSVKNHGTSIEPAESLKPVKQPTLTITIVGQPSGSTEYPLSVWNGHRRDETQWSGRLRQKKLPGAVLLDNFTHVSDLESNLQVQGRRNPVASRSEAAEFQQTVSVRSRAVVAIPGKTPTTVKF